MTGYESYSDYQSYYEYHGNTMVEITRKRSGAIIERGWMLFDTVEEAQDFFYDLCDQDERDYVH